MELTPVERLILANQYQILEKLSKDPDDKKWFADAREIVEYGYELHYEDIAAKVTREPMSRELSTAVLQVMTMFSCLQSSHENLKDKSGIDPSQIRFEGFDANDEWELLNYASFFCKHGMHGRKFDDIVKDHVINSHCPRMDMYRRMLKVFQPMPEHRQLSTESIRKVIAAKAWRQV